MLKPAQYEILYEALAGRGVMLINDPAAYRRCHWLPEWYPALADMTPRSVWLRTGPEVDLADLMTRLSPFGDGSLIVKDFVKSRKHEWAEACFIPNASDREGVERVVRRFLKLQGEDLNEGLVFREFVPLEPIGTHPQSGMPLTKEYRIFFLDGEPMIVAPQWEVGSYTATSLPLPRFRTAAEKVASRLFTMDVAQRKDGDWIVIELGDGQVAGLPEQADSVDFYEALTKARPHR